MSLLYWQSSETESSNANESSIAMFGQRNMLFSHQKTEATSVDAGGRAHGSHGQKQEPFIL